jgi:hypothetical protein
MPPPVPLGGKLFVALLMLGLCALLFRAIQGPFTGRSLVPAVVVSLVIVIALEALLPARYGSGLHDLGILAALVGVVSGAICLRKAAQKAGPRWVATPKWRLVAFAVVSGPIIGVLLATLVVVLADVSSLDRGFMFAVFGSVGAAAGIVAGLVVAVIAR